eukprot:TRINITY_DN15036_c0_g3_i1.p1 TRINITY_DN15036_c0_g3~~TRINITY_DN15036_c0_g3_i1.p1  ORF type:complete len:103 (-),score=5.89 TRINITY_DN15036_c0_g3_i1:62-370(-)
MKEGFGTSSLLFFQVMSPTGLRATFCEIYRENLTSLVRRDLRGSQFFKLTLFFMFIVVWILVGDVIPTTLYGTESSVILFIEKGGGFGESPRQVSCCYYQTT